MLWFALSNINLHWQASTTKVTKWLISPLWLASPLCDCIYFDKFVLYGTSHYYEWILLLRRRLLKEHETLCYLVTTLHLASWPMLLDGASEFMYIYAHRDMDLGTSIKAVFSFLNHAKHTKWATPPPFIALFHQRCMICFATLASQPTCASRALAMTSQGLVEAGYPIQGKRVWFHGGQDSENNWMLYLVARKVLGWTENPDSEWHTHE